MAQFESSKTAATAFTNPPVREVGIGLSLQKNPNWDARILGYFHRHIHQDYPRYQSAMAIVRNMPTPFITVNTVPELRGVYASENNTEFLQLQSDLFIVNWRFDETSKYRGFANLRKRFGSAWAPLTEATSELGMPHLQVLDCEVSYTNHVAPSESGLGAHDLIGAWSGEIQSKPFSTVSLSATIKWSPNFDIIISLQPVLRIADGAQIIQCTLAASGKPSEQSLEAYSATLDALHDELHMCFNQLTSPAAKAYWASEGE